MTIVSTECDDAAFQRHFKKVRNINCTHIIVGLLKALEGDHGKDRVRLCHLSMSFQEGQYQKLLFHLKEIKNYKKAKMKGGLCWMTK